MHPHVQLQPVRLDESFSAEFAAKSFLSRVQSHVIAEAAARRHRLAANITHKSFHLVTYEDVPATRCFRLEYFAARLHLANDFMFVILLVAVQGPFVFEVFMAHFARVSDAQVCRFVFHVVVFSESVRNFVPLQVAHESERLVARIALERSFCCVHDLFVSLGLGGCFEFLPALGARVFSFRVYFASVAFEHISGWETVAAECAFVIFFTWNVKEWYSFYGFCCR